MIIFKIELTSRETMIHNSCANYFNKATFADIPAAIKEFF